MNVRDTVNRFYNEVMDDENHRYRSWEHCYKHFNSPAQFAKDAYAVDHSALHLAFYLASWGMYRGSSGLLWKDYKVFVPIVDLIKDHHETLRDCDYLGDDYHDKLKTCFYLTHALSDELKKITYRKSDDKSYVTPTDTLITKIVLGTLGSAPAYDRYFIQGLSKNIEKPILPKSFEKGFKHLIDIYRQNSDEFKDVAQELTNKSGVTYPVMKIVDMYFWQLGFEQV